MTKMIIKEEGISRIKLNWDLPEYGSDEFNASFPNIEEFRQLPIYEAAVKGGLITDDEWTGPQGGYCPIPRPKKETK
jgi:hypothetical protein